MNIRAYFFQAFKKESVLTYSKSLYNKRAYLSALSTVAGLYSAFK